MRHSNDYFSCIILFDAYKQFYEVGTLQIEKTETWRGYKSHPASGEEEIHTHSCLTPESVSLTHSRVWAPRCVKPHVRETQPSRQTSQSYSHTNSFIKYKSLYMCGDWIFRRGKNLLVSAMTTQVSLPLAHPALTRRPHQWNQIFTLKIKWAPRARTDKTIQWRANSRSLRQGSIEVSSSPVAPGFDPHCSLQVQEHNIQFCCRRLPRDRKHGWAFHQLGEQCKSEACTTTSGASSPTVGFCKSSAHEATAAT